MKSGAIWRGLLWCAAAAGTAPGVWAKPILPGAEEKVVGEKGVGPVDPAAVASAQAQREKDLAAILDWKNRQQARADKLAAGRALIEKDPATALKIADELLTAFSKDEEAADLKKDAQQSLQRKADRSQKEKEEAERKSREAAERAKREQEEASRKSNAAKIEGLVGAGVSALDAGKLDEAAARYKEALALDAGNRDAQRGLEKVETARKDAAERAAREKAEADKKAAKERAEAEKKASEDAEKAAKEREATERKAREASERATREKAEADRKALAAKVDGLVDSGGAALKAGSLDEAAARYNEALGLDKANRDAQRGLEKVGKARKDAADRAAREKAETEQRAREAAEKARKEQEEAARKQREAADKAAQSKAEAERLAGLRRSLDEAVALLKAGKADEAKSRAEALLKEDLPSDLKKLARAIVKDAETAIKASQKK